MKENYKMGTDPISEESESKGSAKIKLIITGSRHFTDYNLVESKLLALSVDKQNCSIMSKLTSGVDMMGFDFARKYNKEILVYPSEKHEDGSNAESVRNEKMVKAASHCIVIWDGKSADLADMITLAKKHNLKLIDIIL